MIRATVVDTSGTAHVETFDSKEPPLEWLQKQVGGYIELLTHQDDLFVWCNEDGRRLDLPANTEAMRRLRNVCPRFEQVILGNVVFVEDAPNEG